VLGRTLVYLNCEVAPLLKGVGEVNRTVQLLVGLLNPPNEKTCVAENLLKKGSAERTPVNVKPLAGAGVLSGLQPQGFGGSAAGAAAHKHGGGR
jgi:hypothetical protein